MLMVESRWQMYEHSLYNFLNFVVYLKCSWQNVWRNNGKWLEGELTGCGHRGSLSSREPPPSDKESWTVWAWFSLLLISPRAWYAGESGLQRAHNWEEDLVKQFCSNINCLNHVHLEVKCCLLPILLGDCIEWKTLVWAQTNPIFNIALLLRSWAALSKSLNLSVSVSVSSGIVWA